MERQTAINIITDIMGCALGLHPYCDRDCDFCAYRIDNKSAIREAFDIALDSLNNRSEAEEYRTPMKPACKGYGYNACPTCGKELVIINPDKKFCPYCGQALDWSEVE